VGTAVICLLFACMLLYILAPLLRNVGDSCRTAIAEEYLREEIWELHGIIIREEAVIPSQGITAFPTAADGQAVAAGTEIAAGPMGSILAPAAGIYVRQTDGYEHLTLQMVSSLSPDDVTEFEAFAFSEAPNLGKIVTDHSWLLAVAITDEQAAHLKMHSHVVFTAKGETELTLTATAVHISPSEKGRCVAVFRCVDHLRSVLHLRQLTVLLPQSRTEGLRIPAAAVYADEGRSFVYIRSASRAEKIYVNILFEEADAVIVSKDSSADALRAGDTVIIGAPNF